MSKTRLPLICRWRGHGWVSQPLTKGRLGWVFIGCDRCAHINQRKFIPAYPKVKR